jgi:hypothetical protein
LLSILLLCLQATVWGVNLDCSIINFHDDKHGNRTICRTSNASFTSEGIEITSIKLDSNGGFCDLSGLIVDKQAVHYVPRGLEMFFPRMTLLQIINSGLKTLEQTDLKPFPELELLILDSNDLQMLATNLFAFNPKLIKVTFSSNDLKCVGHNILAPLVHLKEADFSNCGCVDDFYNDDLKDRGLEKVNLSLKSGCQDPNPKCIIYTKMTFLTTLSNVTSTRKINDLESETWMIG